MICIGTLVRVPREKVGTLYDLVKSSADGYLAVLVCSVYMLDSFGKYKLTHSCMEARDTCTNKVMEYHRHHKQRFD